METKLYTMNGTENGSITLDDQIFAHAAHPQTINDVVKAQLNNQRQGTVNTRTRGEISGTTKKMFKQKGTGRARQGDIKSPLHVGGGTTFGPKPRSFDQRPPKKVVDRAIIGVLSGLVQEGSIRVVEGLEFSTGKTKDVVTFMTAHAMDKALFVVSNISNETKRAVANLRNVKVVTPMHVNVVDLLKYGKVAINKEAVTQLQEVLVK
jgi:large subunit ribosomal protein L4